MTSEDYILDVGASAARRLLIQHELYANSSQQFLVNAGLKSKENILDVGCGVGLMSNWIAQQVAEIGIVVAIDYSQAQVDIAKQQANQLHLKNIEYHALDVYKLADAWQSKFDLIYCRLFLGHLSKPIFALQTMLKCLKPGGTIVCEEMTHDSCFCYPASSALRDFVNAVKLLQSKLNLADHGNQIFKVFSDLNLQNINIDISQPLLKTHEQRSLFAMNLNEIAPRLLKESIVDQKQVDQLYTSLLALAEKDNFMGYMRCTHILAKKD